MNDVEVGPVSIEFSTLVDAGILGIATDNPLVPRDVTTFDAGVTVVKNAILAHPDGTFVCDVRIEKTPYKSCWVIVPKLV